MIPQPTSELALRGRRLSELIGKSSFMWFIYVWTGKMPSVRELVHTRLNVYQKSIHVSMRKRMRHDSVNDTKKRVWPKRWNLVGACEGKIQPKVYIVYIEASISCNDRVYFCTAILSYNETNSEGWLSIDTFGTSSIMDEHTKEIVLYPDWT